MYSNICIQPQRAHKRKQNENYASFNKNIWEFTSLLDTYCILTAMLIF